MAHTKITPELKKKVIEYLKEPKSSQNKAVKKFGIGLGSVNRIVQESSGKSDLEHSKTKNANTARKAYAKAEREELIDKFLSKLSGMLDSPELKPGQMQGLAIALGTALDKRRLEEGSNGQGKAALLVLMEEIRKNAEASRASNPAK